MAIRTFANKATEMLAAGIGNKITFRLLPHHLHESALEKLNIRHSALNVSDLHAMRSLRLEALRGDRQGQYSIRINRQFRICFEWRNGDAWKVEIVDYH